MPDQTDAEKILAMLKAAPRTTQELHAAARKYTSRVSDLRAEGHKILATRIGGSADYLYTLVPSGEKKKG